MTIQKFYSALVVAIAIAIPHSKTLAQTPSSSLFASENRSLPNPPDNPPPNQTKPGRGLDPNRSSCNRPHHYLTALVPIEGFVNTVSAHPTILFYIPDRALDVRYGEFFINTREEERVGEIVRFQLPDTPGIVSVRLPELPENALEEGQLYHWFFKLYCQENEQSQTGVVAVSGWFKRVPMTPENEQLIMSATPELWYDAIALLAQQLLAAPQDSTLRERWLQLLQLIDEEELAEQPILGSVQVLEK
jgi:hypothetical protein